jgi:arsenate reductase/regulatory protein spx|tara:strand:+ start:258 stop:551 length:294 start_codon:yes stop_codon:yes gene_type:complete
LQAGVLFRERDIFQEPLHEIELRELIRTSKPASVFSWRSPSFKKLGLDPEDLEEDDLIRLMLKEPRLIRRPLIRVADKLFIGAKLDELLEDLGLKIV